MGPVYINDAGKNDDEVCFQENCVLLSTAIEAAPDEILETLGSERLQREEKKRVDV